MSFINFGEVDPLAQQIQAGTQAAQAGFDFFKSVFGPSAPPVQKTPVIPQPQVITIPQARSGVDPKILMIGGGAAALIVIAMLLKKKKGK